MKVRLASKEDIPAILELLVQVDMVHHSGRPDIFKGPATKYNAKELEEIIANSETPVFVCVDEERIKKISKDAEQQELAVKKYLK